MKRPWRQGSLDGLCGVYALINAMRFFEPRLDQAACLALFACITDEMGEQGLLPRSLWRGLTANEIYRLVPSLQRVMRRSFGLAFSRERPFRQEDVVTTRRFLTALRHMLTPANEAVALIGWTEEERHWSVVHRVGRRTLRLIDSGPDPVSHLRLSQCSAAGSASARYWIDPRATIVLRRAARGEVSRDDFGEHDGRMVRKVAAFFRSWMRGIVSHVPIPPASERARDHSVVSTFGSQVLNAHIG